MGPFWRHIPAKGSGGHFQCLLVYLAAVCYGLSFVVIPAHDPDLGWHLFGGAWVSHNGALPAYDPVNSFNPFWHDYHWLAQFLFYQVYRLGGYSLLRVGLALSMAYVAKVMIDLVYLSSRKAPRPLLVVILFLVAMRSISEVTTVRPQLLALIGISIALRRLIQRPTRFEIPLLFVIAALLANMHVYWILIPFLWFTCRCLPGLLRSRSPSTLYAWGGLLILGAAGLFSPYGLIPFGIKPPSLFMNYWLIGEYLLMPEALKDTIGEFRGALSIGGVIPILFLLSLAIIARRLRWKRLLADSGNSATLFVFLLLSLRDLKFIALFGVALIPWSTRHILPWLSRLIGRVPLSRAVEQLTVFALILYSLVFTTTHMPPIHNNDHHIASLCPLDACESIAKLSPPSSNGRDHVRVLTHFNYGGWCRWKMYETNPDLDARVTTDGRTQGVPPQHFFDSYDVFNLKNSWLTTLKDWNPDVILAHKSSALANFLVFIPDIWKLEFEDDNFVVFIPAA